MRGDAGLRRGRRTGFTTGACAAAAACAATLALRTGAVPDTVTITLPTGVSAIFAVAEGHGTATTARAVIIKD
ncbi:MAG: cobalt-precorrin-5B (C(1))-methyltransferase, partial [Magnetococcales bacterium]|nr:cobalt-precorrin-5B (C(1))-methyltransferase [Magnetococcales bacterium]